MKSGQNAKSVLGGVATALVLLGIFPSNAGAPVVRLQIASRDSFANATAYGTAALMS